MAPVQSVSILAWNLEPTQCKTAEQRGSQPWGPARSGSRGRKSESQEKPACWVPLQCHVNALQQLRGHPGLSPGHIDYMELSWECLTGSALNQVKLSLEGWFSANHPYCQKCLFFVFCNHDEFPTLKSVLPPSTSLNTHLLSADFSLLISFQIKQIDWIYWVSHHQACFMDHSFTESCSSFELLPIFQHQF